MSKTELPQIICHMMTTFDGKITSGTGENILDDYFSLYTKIEDKLNAKSWIIGRVTMQAFADNLTIELPKIRSRIDDKDYIVSIPNDYNVLPQIRRVFYDGKITQLGFPISKKTSI